MKKLFAVILLVMLLAGSAWSLETGKIKVEKLARSSSSWDGGILPDYPSGLPEITILKITIPPHTTLPWHKHPVINAGYMLKGKLTVITDEHKTLHLKAGDTIVEVVNRWHYGRNDGDKPVEIVVFYAGVKGLPTAILKNKK